MGKKLSGILGAIGQGLGGIANSMGGSGIAPDGSGGKVQEFDIAEASNSLKPDPIKKPRMPKKF